VSDLTTLFTDIANAIRSKKGTNDSIIAENFPNEIATIEAGGNIDLNNTNLTNEELKEKTTIYGAFANLQTNATDLTRACENFEGETIPIIDASNTTIFDYMFLNATNLKGDYSSSRYMFNITGKIDMTAGKSAKSMFEGCTSLGYIQNNPINGTLEDVSCMFKGCTSLTNFAGGLRNIKNANSMFEGCSKLTNPNVQNCTVIESMDDCFKGCTALTESGLNNAIRMAYYSVSTYKGTKTLKAIGLTQAQAATVNTSSTCSTNWTTLKNNGWKTGY
jgi:hypothetical protein